jgi:hypothetical protein
VRTTPRTEEAAQKESTRKLLYPGWKDGEITDALERASKRGNDMIELSVMIRDADGRTLRDWLTNTPLGAAKLRHACAAVGALALYESGEIGQADFPGHAVRVKIGIKKQRGYPDSAVRHRRTDRQFVVGIPCLPRDSLAAASDRPRDGQGRRCRPAVACRQAGDSQDGWLNSA